MNRLKGMTKILTISLVAWIIFAASAWSQIVNLESHQTYQRLNLFIVKDLIEIEKDKKYIAIKTLNVDVYNKLKKSLNKIRFNNKYIKNVSYRGTVGNDNNVSTITIELASDSVDLFSFYQEKEKKYIFDFWNNSDQIDLRKGVISRKDSIKKESVKNKISTKRKLTVLTAKKTKKIMVSAKQQYEKITLFKFDKEYRDYRYGAPFIWNYRSLAPKHKSVIDIETKTAEYFYPIKDREYNKNALEVHLQLTINMYRKKKWGLMNKSIDLFNKKYSKVVDQYVALHEFLKANALLMTNIQNKDMALMKMAINMYKTVAKRTDDYFFKRAIYKYLISYFIEGNEAVQGLQAAKRYYVLTLNNFDREESVWASESILYFLSKLNQIDTLQKFIDEKTTKKILPPQIMYAYRIYTLLKLGKYKKVIKLYEENKKSLVSPVHPVILYNVAESLFRDAQYEKAIRKYDKFLEMYSHYHQGGHARLRIALCYELLEKDIDQTIELYRNAINRGQDIAISYEAKIRYVALTSIRKRKPSKEDMESRVLLEKKSNDLYAYSYDLNKLLWLVRLRTFIVDNKFQQALSYLNAIPITSLSLSEVRVFEGDGAEVVYGILFELYKESEYSKIVKVWEVYKNKYIAKVAMDPFLNFIVGSAYIKLGLFKGYERLYSSFEKIKNTPPKTFPTWNKRIQINDPRLMLLELKVVSNLKLGNAREVKKYLAELDRIAPNYAKVNFYKGIMYFKLKKYKFAAKYLEEYLSSKDSVGVYDAAEIANMLTSYADSLYELNMLSKFKKIARAILDDTDKYAVKNEFMNNLKERMSYLLIEMLGAEEKQGDEFANMVAEFKEKYNKSSYLSRINYLHAMIVLKKGSEEEAKKMLEILINDDKVSDYIKELAKSELTLIKIKKRIL